MQVYRGKGERREPETMNKRQTDILRILYKDRSYVTYGEIAKQLGVSVGTVRNDIAVIKEALARAEAGELETKPHAGVRLVSTSDSLKALPENSGEDDREIFFFIIRHLLKNGSLTAQRLAQQYYLGRSQTEKILEQVSHWFSDNRIVFERRRGKGISIRCSEFNYRAACLNFCMEYRDMHAGLITERQSGHSLITDRDYTAICAALDGFDVSPAIEAVAELEDELRFRFSYISALGLVFMLSLACVRMKKDIEVEMPETGGREIGCGADRKMAELLKKSLNDKTGLCISDSETDYIRFAAAVSEIQELETGEGECDIESLDPELCALTVKAVKLISEVAGIDLRCDGFFVRQLFLQLRVTTARLRYGITVKNPLLDKIKSGYPNMMAVAWLLGNVFEKELGLEINEHEVGYMALHIGGAVERHLTQLSAYVVCDYGIGISHILREKISRAIPELMVTGVYSARDMRSIKSGQCDFIITTTPLDGYRLNHDIVRVGHLLDESDIQSIKAEMKNIRSMRKEKMKAIMPYESLFHPELIFTDCSVRNKDELLKMLCKALSQSGFVTDGFEKSVLERERIAATGIGKGIAAPHGMSNFVNRSAVVYASLKQPIEWRKGESVDTVFLLAFDLADDGGMKKEIIGFYKSLVSFTEADEDEFRRLKELKDKNEIMKIFKKW